MNKTKIIELNASSSFSAIISGQSVIRTLIISNTGADMRSVTLKFSKGGIEKDVTFQIKGGSRLFLKEGDLQFFLEGGDSLMARSNGSVTVICSYETVAPASSSSSSSSSFLAASLCRDIPGIEITARATGPTWITGGYPVVCGETSWAVRPGSIALGGGGQAGPFNYTLNFSRPVTIVSIVVTGGGTASAATEENLVFTASGNPMSVGNAPGPGGPALNCGATIDGNELVLSCLNEEALGCGGGIFEITNDIPFSEMTITGVGGNGVIFCVWDVF
jgi:hypothetical protein